MTTGLTQGSIRMLSAFLETTHDHVLVYTDADGVIEGWLGAAERVIGYAHDEVMGRSLSILFTPEDQALGLDQHELGVARTQGRSEDDRWHVRKDGSRFWASGVLTAIRDDSGTLIGFCKLLRDKTDVRMRLQLLEDKLNVRNADIEAQNNFFTTTAHELRNPLMPIASALDLLGHPGAPELVDKAKRILQNQLAVLTKLIDDLASIDRGHAQHTLQLEPVNLNEALRAVTDAFQPQAEAEGKSLVLLLPPTDLLIAADTPRLQQMLLNLINNALKYTGPGCRIVVSATIEARMAIVRVEDDGMGISAESLLNIFELFTREKRHAPVAGLGVGLAVVKELAQMHGGNVEARSQGVGKGSVFGLRLPLSRS